MDTWLYTSVLANNLDTFEFLAAACGPNMLYEESILHIVKDKRRVFYNSKKFIELLLHMILYRKTDFKKFRSDPDLQEIVQSECLKYLARINYCDFTKVVLMPYIDSVSLIVPFHSESYRRDGIVKALQADRIDILKAVLRPDEITSFNVIQNVISYAGKSPSCLEFFQPVVAQMSLNFKNLMYLMAPCFDMIMDAVSTGNMRTIQAARDILNAMGGRRNMRARERNSWGSFVMDWETLEIVDECVEFKIIMRFATDKHIWNSLCWTFAKERGCFSK